MAVGIVAVEDQERHYGGRITAFVALSCMTAGMGGVIFGYDIGIAGNGCHERTSSKVQPGTPKI
jgi:MFS transporter, SP family, sugar:H+ symporter